MDDCGYILSCQAKSGETVASMFSATEQTENEAPSIACGSPRRAIADEHDWLAASRQEKGMKGQ